MSAQAERPEVDLTGEPYRWECVECGCHWDLRKLRRSEKIYCNQCGASSREVHDKKRGEAIELH